MNTKPYPHLFLDIELFCEGNSKPFKTTKVLYKSEVVLALAAGYIMFSSEYTFEEYIDTFETCDLDALKHYILLECINKPMDITYYTEEQKELFWTHLDRFEALIKRRFPVFQD